MTDLAGESRAPADPVASGPGGTASEWPGKAVDAVDLVVAMVNDKAVRPLILAARAVVFGLVIALSAVVLMTVLCIALVRVLDVYVVAHHVWGAYAILGGLFLVGGLFAWTKRTPSPSKAN